MKKRDKILKILADVKPILMSKFGVKRLGLFGSCARGDFTSRSDVDILIDVDPSIGLDFVNLAEFIEDALGLPVDLVSRRAVRSRYMRVIRQELIYV